MQKSDRRRFLLGSIAAFAGASVSQMKVFGEQFDSDEDVLGKPKHQHRHHLPPHHTHPHPHPDPNPPPVHTTGWKNQKIYSARPWAAGVTYWNIDALPDYAKEVATLDGGG